jgi:hypothetical protein
MTNRSSDPNLEGRIRESIYRLWFRLRKYAQAYDCSASPSDFADQIEERVARRLSGNADTVFIDSAVQNIGKLLAHEKQRTAQRRAKFYDPVANIETIHDPKSVTFATKLEVESHVRSQMRVIRQNVTAEELSILEKLYGFSGDEWSIEKLAKKMNLQEDTLDKRLHRLYVKLREKLECRR